MLKNWWEGSYEDRMLVRRARRFLQRLEVSPEQNQATWARHGEKYVRLRKQKAKKPWSYEEWLHRKAGEAMAEEIDLWRKYVRGGRLHMIWTCVVEATSEERFLRSPTLPQADRIKFTPRIRGCGAAAKRAGF